MKKVSSFFIVFLTCLLFPSLIFAEAQINEVYPVGKDDWVEIINPDNATSPVDLSHYTLRDSSKTNKISLKGTIPPGGFAVFAFGNKLNNGGDTIRLLLDDTKEVDKLSFGKGQDCVPSEGQSFGRDKNGNLLLFSSPTKGQVNVNGEICKSTSQSVSESTPTPTLTPTNTPSPVATPSKVLSTETEAPETSFPVPTDTFLASTAPTVSPLAVKSKPNPFGNLFIIIGVLLCIFSVAGFIFTIKKRYNEIHVSKVE